ncbi:Gfo/Idh/MocA family oxidoreductase [Vagococcus carniphilus]|uniref:Gfo/Idh/MocA family oxidoreductase n=1 Tax=Vagococcus carniphilus TaxID=218144 RepID=A0AAW8U840_9ENTE|nr:Gfo/Idh/MocA family oxidoreductase [Vagococcus carniphilus]MDT2833168.1 Gfo/Idh/MocA family oxidoreductase [Vagococcus carniphilus]
MINKIGVVGTGDIAGQFVSQINQDKYQIVSVFNHRETSLKTFTETHKIPHKTTNYEAFLANDKIDCVYIATPNQTHYEYALKALQAGKHVLCEKVMVMKGEEAKKLFAVAKEKNLVLLEAVTLFYMPMYSTVQQLLKNNKLGKLSNANITFGSCKEYDPNNRFFSLEKGGGALFDIGTYALSAAVYLLNTSLQLIATDVSLSESGVDEKSMTLLKNADDVQASVMISFRGKMPKQIILTGDKGYLLIDDFPRAEKGQIFYNDGEVEMINQGTGHDVFTYEMDRVNQYAKGEIDTEDLREITERIICLMDEMRESWDYLQD